MDKTSLNSSTWALCVGLSPGELPSAVASQLEQACCRVEYCDDVYRALARIGRQAPAVVIVGVDWLPSAAFEFFEIVARPHRDLPVYVLGADHAPHKRERAIACGARGLVTTENLAEVLDGPPRRAEPQRAETEVTGDADTGAKEPGEFLVPEKPESLASAGNVFDAELDGQLREEVAAAWNGPADTATTDASGADTDAAAAAALEEDKGGFATGGVRVPWHSYRGGPQRIPPQRGAPPASLDTEKDFDPPLLTPEELAALLGDEPASETE